MEKTLIIILGPTGIGKSDLSINIARHFDTEIVSADSRQIFRELSIGTAVPSPSDLKRVKHHLIQNLSIHDDYNASKYETDALEIINHLFKSKDIVILCGGSMLYIDAVCKGIDIIPDVNQQIHEQILKGYNEQGIEHLRFKLKKLDPVYYNKVDLKNTNRIIHALDITLTTGKPYSSYRTGQKKQRSFKIIKIGLNTDRQILYDRINYRVDKMIKNGLIEEAKSVYPYHQLNALNTVGYKELFDYFDKKSELHDVIKKIKTNTRHYAKKQLTWFRRDDEIHWFQPSMEKEIINFIQVETQKK
ncbi:MAG: tRNA (adenosine(37)-N6)-dimethylallyltransferase MiaA [Prolixibacteraceae bacterium]|nr:tRNA (adenosine(37)-N6)-dimethylallyltransferase MiaA [Prolixibacteraceae bacterium]